jgi:hypothetical protein
MATSLGVHPHELSRRISEIDLTTLRGRSDTPFEKEPHYTGDELTDLRHNEKYYFGHATAIEGLKTPPEIPAPPSTPHHESGSPDLCSEDKAAAEAPVKEGTKNKKKKKKSSKKNKKPSPTGFEGALPLASRESY